MGRNDETDGFLILPVTCRTVKRRYMMAVSCCTFKIKRDDIIYLLGKPLHVDGETGYYIRDLSRYRHVQYEKGKMLGVWYVDVDGTVLRLDLLSRALDERQEEKVHVLANSSTEGIQAFTKLIYAMYGTVRHDTGNHNDDYSRGVQECYGKTINALKYLEMSIRGDDKLSPGEKSTLLQEIAWLGVIKIEKRTLAGFPSPNNPLDEESTEGGSPDRNWVDDEMDRFYDENADYLEEQMRKEQEKSDLTTLFDTACGRGRECPKCDIPDCITRVEKSCGTCKHRSITRGNCTFPDGFWYADTPVDPAHSHHIDNCWEPRPPPPKPMPDLNLPDDHGRPRAKDMLKEMK